MSLTQQQLEAFPQIILQYPHYWDPQSIFLTKGSHSEEEEYLFTGIAEICVNTLCIKVHETEIEPGLRDTVHDASFIAKILVSQVIIANAKVSDSTRITDIDKNVSEC